MYSKFLLTITLFLILHLSGDNCPEIEAKPVDCADVLQLGHSRSGIYEIWPMSRLTKGKALKVYCDMDTDGGGWTVSIFNF